MEILMSYGMSWARGRSGIPAEGLISVNQGIESAGLCAVSRRELSK